MKTIKPEVLIVPVLLIAIFFLSGCSDSNSLSHDLEINGTVLVDNSTPALAYLQHNETYNPEAVIPPQCYTKTEGNKNPCFVCHQSYSDPERPNFVKDMSLQGSYEFSEEGMTNSWKNLFKDRSKEITSISEQTIMNWIGQDNYTPFIQGLKQDKGWKGEVAEIENLAYPEQAFYPNGIAKDGSHWLAYNYKPFPSSFWPTNGSTGDAMIRLPNKFREVNGRYSEKTYLANLAILEKTIKAQSIKVQSNKTTGISKDNYYLGDASTVAVEHMLYPQGTEFLHTVRYLGLDDEGRVFNAPRMKEVRYMKKAKFRSLAALKSAYFIEAKEKKLGQLPRTTSIGDRGIDNGFGWIINGYIEDQEGQLRQQNKQELAFCNGCHKTLGSTIDQVFSFSRKVDGDVGWGYIDLTKIKDVPSKGSELGEYLTYFDRTGGGDEFRQNKEMLQRWFHPDGEVNKEAVNQVESIYQLIVPSKERALALNKAYLTIVKEQSYIFGRDAVLAPATNVFQKIDTHTNPLQEDYRYGWDIRLDWGAL